MGSLGPGVNLGPITVAGEGAGVIKALRGLSARKTGESGLAGQVSHTMSATKKEASQRQGSGVVFSPPPSPNNHTRFTTGFQAAEESWQLAGKGEMRMDETRMWKYLTFEEHPTESHLPCHYPI